MPLSIGQNKYNINLTAGSDVTTSRELTYRPGEGWQPSTETELNALNIGADLHQETIKYDIGNKIASVTAAGPSAGLELGFKANHKKAGLSLMAEASAARVETSLNVTENAALYAAANLNANTGVKVGTDGVEVNFLGFGVTLGVGGKFTFNTPVGSVGGCAAPAMTMTNSARNTGSNVLYN